MEKLKKHIESIINIYKSGNLSKAEILAEQAIKDNPRVAFLYNLLGLILAEQKKDTQAIKCYEKGISVDPNYGMIYNNIGLLFFKDKSSDGIKNAEGFYKKAISLDKKIPEPLNNLGNLYEYLNKINEAIECYKKAIEINSRFSYAHHNLGTAYVAIGKFKEAKIHFKESIKLNPDFAVTHRSLSRITKYTLNDDHFTELKKAYENLSEHNTGQKIELGYALGKAYEDIKNFKQSFAYYSEANFLQRKKINFSIKNEEKNFYNIKKFYNKELFKKYKNSGFKEYSPIFIIGMPRSSTTLVEQIMSSHSEVYGAEEVEFIPELMEKKFNSFKDLEKIGEDYIIKMKKLSGGLNRTTDKLPINFLNVGFIKLILPKSKIIHCYRNAEDNCLSIYKNQFGGGKISFAYDIDEIVSYYNLYLDLIKYWKKTLPNFIYDIKYENLISNTKKEIKNLLINCELSWSNNCLKFYKNDRPIKTASDTQVRNKIYNTSIQSWKNYEKFLSKHFNKLKIS